MPVENQKIIFILFPFSVCLSVVYRNNVKPQQNPSHIIFLVVTVFQIVDINKLLGEISLQVNRRNPLRFANIEMFHNHPGSQESLRHWLQTNTSDICGHEVFREIHSRTRAGLHAVCLLCKQVGWWCSQSGPALLLQHLDGPGSYARILFMNVTMHSTPSSEIFSTETFPPQCVSIHVSVDHQFPDRRAAGWEMSPKPSLLSALAHHRGVSCRNFSSPSTPTTVPPSTQLLISWRLQMIQQSLTWSKTVTNLHIDRRLCSAKTTWSWTHSRLWWW